MSYLYVDETGSKLGIEGGRIIVKTEKGTERSLPLETLEGVILLNKSQLSTQCIEKLLIKGIPVSFFQKVENTLGDSCQPVILNRSFKENSVLYMIVLSH